MKFKHTKLGWIAESIKNVISYYIRCRNIHINKELVENSNDWKEIILTTFDGKNLFFQDPYVIIRDIDPNYISTGYRINGNSQDYLRNDVKYFSTKEIAEKYIEDNKKKFLFKTEDGVDVRNCASEVRCFRVAPE